MIGKEARVIIEYSCPIRWRHLEMGKNSRLLTFHNLFTVTHCFRVLDHKRVSFFSYFFFFSKLMRCWVAPFSYSSALPFCVIEIKFIFRLFLKPEHRTNLWHLVWLTKLLTACVWVFVWLYCVLMLRFLTFDW